MRFELPSSGTTRYRKAETHLNLRVQEITFQAASRVFLSPQSVTKHPFTRLTFLAYRFKFAYMALLTAQRITSLFNGFKTIDVAFNSSVSRALGLNPKEIFLKCLGQQFRCVIYSSSMTGAKVVMSVTKETLTHFRKANNAVSLRYCFTDDEKSVPITFFVPAKIMGFTPYGSNPELNFITLNFTSQPPDALVSALGILIEANVNAKRRAEERILMNQENIRKLAIKPKSSVLSITGIPRACILRDLSFSGAMVIISGIGKFLLEKEATLRLEFDDLKTFITIKGKVQRFEEVQGRKELSALGILFHQEELPIEYKMKINDFLNRLGKASPNSSS